MDDYMPILKSTDNEDQCAVCSNSAKNKCAACEAIAYCSTEHQIAHWHNHRKSCLPYKILHDEVMGRYAVAVRDLLPGEVILRESPVAVGPKHYSPPLCLGCLSPIRSSKDLRLCTSCGWPVCSEECEHSACHAENECPIFASARIRFLWNPACVGGSSDTDSAWVSDNPMLQCITPLRLLLAKDRDSKRWDEEVVPMEAHMNERQNSHTWKSDLVNVSGFLRKACRLAERLSDDDIMWACGILQVNAFEARAGRGGSAQCLFPRLAIFSHSCVPNITHSIDAHFNMVGRVSIAVGRGQPLNTCYTHTLLPTLERREYLRLSKFFDCLCNRCADPTELGENLGPLHFVNGTFYCTNISTILCKKCSDPSEGNILSTNPLDPNATWKCKGCGTERSALSVELQLESLEARPAGSKMRSDNFGPSPDDPIELEEALRRCSSVLHPNHSMLSCLRLSLSQIYGNTNKLPLKDFLPIMLEHKVQLCKNIMSVADIIEPGLTRLRGTTLYEICDSLELLAKNEFNKGTDSYENYYKSLKITATLLEEAVSILSLEESGSIEAEMCLKAKAKLYGIQKTLNDRKIIYPDQHIKKNKVSHLEDTFKDFKLDVNADANEIQEAKKKDESNLIEFANDVKKTSYNLTATHSDLTDIILNLKEQSPENSFGDLQIFHEMIEGMKETNDCITEIHVRDA